MDSGSSGSMQSSSGGGGGAGGGGGDEEYDSRGGESITSFLNHRHQPSSGHFGSISSNPQPSPLLSHQQSSSHHHQPTFFDLHSQNLDTFQQSLSTPNNNNEMVWCRGGLRSEASNYGNFGNSSSLSLSSSSQSFLGAQGISQAPLASSSSMPLQPSVEGSGVRVSSQLDQTINVKNPKKRTRASRRAPTTVLTTDTTNFRQMVQEFTGIPAAPFSGSSGPYSRRLDLFSTAGRGGSAMRAGGQLDALGSLYPLRPSAQKVQLSPFISASSTSNNTITTTSIDGTSNTINSSTNTFQIPSNLGLQKQPQNILNMQNQLLAFQPLLQATQLPPSLKLPMGNEPFFSTRSLQGSTSMPPPSIDEQLGMSHFSSNQGSSEARQARDDENLPRWRDGGTFNNGGQEHELGSFDGNDHHGNARHVSGFKLNSSSSSDFYPEKVLENASSGGTDFRNYN